MQFAYALLTRSQRVSHENLRLRDRTWLEGMEQWFAERASRRPVQIAVPPMFTPFRLRELELANRIAVSPMAMYSADGRRRRRLPPGAAILESDRAGWYRRDQRIARAAKKSDQIAPLTRRRTRPNPEARPPVMCHSR